MLSNPTQSKQDRKWGQGSGVRASLGALGSLWRDRKEDWEEEEEEEDQEMYTPHTTTLKGTRVTSSNGDNYIILSPVSPEGQVSVRRRGLYSEGVEHSLSVFGSSTEGPAQRRQNNQN